MKLKFSLKNKEIGFDADVEGIVEKSLNYKQSKPDKKTRYQIKQEEKRKNKELEFEQTKRTIILLSIFLVFILVVCFVGSIFFD